MTKTLKMIGIAFLLLLVSGCGRGHDTLQEAIQAKWETPIQVVNEDEEHRLAIYLDQTQYIFGVYEYKNGKYAYDNSQSSGWTASSDKGIPFLVRAEYKNDIDNFIWGAVYTDTPIDKIFIEYENGLTQETKAVNNTFILQMPETFKGIEDTMLMGEIYDVTAYDQAGSKVVGWRN